MGDHDLLNDINFSYGILKSRASVQRQLREDYFGMDRVSSLKTESYSSANLVQTAGVFFWNLEYTVFPERGFVRINSVLGRYLREKRVVD